MADDLLCVNSSSTLMRPIETFSEGRTQTYVVLLWVSLVWYVFALVFFTWRAPMHERLRLRTRSLALFAFVAAVDQVCIGPLPYQIGYGNYPCWFGAITALFVVPFFGVFFLVRLIQLFYYAEFSKDSHARRKQQDQQGHRDSSLSTNALAESTINLREYSSWELFISAMRLLVQGRKDENTLRGLHASQWVLSGKGLACILALLLLPVLLVVIILFALNPIYVGGCNGCFLTWAITAVIIIEALVVLTMGLIMFQRLQGQDDVWGFKNEVRLVTVFALLSVIFFALSQIFPNDGGSFDWGMLLVVCIWCITFCLLVLPVILAVQDERAKLSPHSKTAAHFLMVNDVLVNPDFEELCQQEFTLESLWFLRDSQAWKDAYFAISKESRQARANKLVNTYIRPGALYEVNLPFKISRDVLAKVDGHELEPHVFDAARKEISLLLERGSLYRFSKTTKGVELIKSNESQVSASA